MTWNSPHHDDHDAARRTAGDARAPTKDRAAAWELAAGGFFAASFAAFMTGFIMINGQTDAILDQADSCRALRAQGNMAEAAACFEKKADMDGRRDDTLLYSFAVSGGLMALAGGCFGAGWRAGRAQERAERAREADALTRRDFRRKDRGHIAVIKGGRPDRAP